jgi:hypothetical protein
MPGRGIREQPRGSCERQRERQKAGAEVACDTAGGFRKLDERVPLLRDRKEGIAGNGLRDTTRSRGRQQQSHSNCSDTQRFLSLLFAGERTMEPMLFSPPFPPTSILSDYSLVWSAEDGLQALHCFTASFLPLPRQLLRPCFSSASSSFPSHSRAGTDNVCTHSRSILPS